LWMLVGNSNEYDVALGTRIQVLTDALIFPSHDRRGKPCDHRPRTALEKQIQSRRKAWEAHKNTLENSADKFVLYIRALSYMLLIYY